MVPTFEADDRFWNEYDHLRAEQQATLREARYRFIAVLVAAEREGCPGIPQFPKALGVKPMTARRNIWELARSGDGRCTWAFGTPRMPGKYHITWRRIGSHAIYADP